MSHFMAHNDVNAVGYVPYRDPGAQMNAASP